MQPNKTGFIHYLDAKTGKFIKATPFADKITWAKGYDANGRPIDMVPLPKEGGDAVETLAEPAGRGEHVSERLQPEDRRLVSGGHQRRA